MLPVFLDLGFSYKKGDLPPFSYIFFKFLEGNAPFPLASDILPEDNALWEGVEAVDQLQLRISPQRDHLVHLLQLTRDNAEPGHEVSQPLLP